jgi:hypothetical protein
MAVISVPESEPWMVARWAFRMVMEHAIQALDDDGDIAAVRQAVAIDGLHLDLLPPDQAARLARALEHTAGEVRTELRSKPSTDPRDGQLAEYLTSLESSLQRAYSHVQRD